jgi:putative lipoprotein
VIAPVLFALALQHPPDAWFGPDKIKHFFIAGFTQSVSYSLLQAGRMSPDRALAGAWAVTAAVSVAKEVRDRRSYGLFSVRDLVWDAAGAGVATLIIRRTVRDAGEAPPAPGPAAVRTVRTPALLSVAAPSPILARGYPSLLRRDPEVVGRRRAIVLPLP